MAATWVQSGNSPTTPATVSTSLTVTFGSATTADNLVVLILGGDKNHGALTAIPSGFTAEYSLPSTSTSLYYIWGVSAGESTFDISWTTPANSGAYAWGGEYSEAGAGPWALLAKASHITDETAVNAWDTGTTAAISQDGIAIAGFAIDSGGNADGVTSWSNGFTTRDFNSVLIGSSTPAGWAIVGENTITSGNTAGTTMTYTGVADQLSGAVAVFARTVIDILEPGPVVAVTRSNSRFA